MLQAQNPPRKCLPAGGKSRNNSFVLAMPPIHIQHFGFQTEGGLQPSFQYSQCTGRRKALCVRCCSFSAFFFFLVGLYP